MTTQIPPLVIMAPGIGGTLRPAHPVDAIPEIARHIHRLGAGDYIEGYQHAATLAMQLLAAQVSAWFSHQEHIGQALSRPPAETLQVLSFAMHRIVSDTWPDECEQEARRRGEETDRERLTAA